MQSCPAYICTDVTCGCVKNLASMPAESPYRPWSLLLQPLGMWQQLCGAVIHGEPTGISSEESIQQSRRLQHIQEKMLTLLRWLPSEAVSKR
eukprot:364568-Chlamydomonas_euryale.AAC.17